MLTNHASFEYSQRVNVRMTYLLWLPCVLFVLFIDEHQTEVQRKVDQDGVEVIAAGYRRLKKRSRRVYITVTNPMDP